MKKINIFLLIVLITVLNAKAQTPSDGNYLQDRSQEISDSLRLLKEQNEDLKIQLQSIEDEKTSNKIWGKGRFLRLGYAFTQTMPAGGRVENGKYGFFLTKGTSYLFPKKALGGLVKIGVDAIWFDTQFAQYKSPYDGWGEIPSGDPDEFMNIGRYALSFGMGVGPNVSIAPFAISSVNIMKPLRISLYFHYAPTGMLYMKSESGDMEVSAAFCNMLKFGGTLTYRRVGVGVETFWGRSKFKPMTFDDYIEDTGILATEKYTRKFANTHFFVQFAF